MKIHSKDALSKHEKNALIIIHIEPDVQAGQILQDLLNFSMRASFFVYVAS